MVHIRLLLICALSALFWKVARAQIAFVEDQDIDKKKANLAVSVHKKPKRHADKKFQGERVWPVGNYEAGNTLFNQTEFLRQT